ncbi:MAG: prolipoprotein diacylglyceryl transferase, partial [Sphingopyxis sp.]|nr:prolipoprotein diacylglyceryl transferase [Sphingopyxis sp.]
FVEFFRQPDLQRMNVVEATGLSMGQWLTVPMIVIGIWLVATAKGRRQRVEPVAGPDAIA